MFKNTNVSRLAAFLLLVVFGVCFYSYTSSNLVQILTVLPDTPALPPEYQNLRWHRFVTDNFEIVSIDKDQGKNIKDKSEEIRSWIYKKWGLQNVAFTNKCIVVCVKDKETFKKWFKKDDIEPKLTKSKNLDGTDREVYAIWVCGETMGSNLREKISRVCLLNYEKTYNIKLPSWSHVGISFLNNDIQVVKTGLQSIDEKTSNLAQIKLDQCTPEEKYNAACFCLFLRKQHNGDKKFISFLEAYNASGSDVNSIVSVYGWKSGDEMAASYVAYRANLVYDLKSGRTPDMGLFWFVK